MSKALFVGGPAHGQWIITNGALEIKVPIPVNPGTALGWLAGPNVAVYWRRTIDLLGRRGWVYVHVGSRDVAEMLLFELLISEEGKKTCGF